jgi:hypothetical protein
MFALLWNVTIYINKLKRQNQTTIKLVQSRKTTTSVYKYIYIVACFPGNATNNLWVLDLTLVLLGIRQAELQLAVTQSYCNYNTS